MSKSTSNYHLRWLLDNQGKYQIISDNTKWYRENGEEFINKFSMAYKGTQISCVSLTEAIDFFIDNENKYKENKKYGNSIMQRSTQYCS